MFSRKALRLIKEFEGVNQPGHWPGHKSGVTLGYGYDLGYVTVDELEADWEDCFTPPQLERLRQAVGKRGQDARAIAATLADIRCTAADAVRVLQRRSIPAYTDLARRTFPGFERLPLDAQGALVSLVLNRGSSMTDSPGTDNRREMRAIRELVPRRDLAGIAAAVRSMQRLWKGQNLGGLLRRREAEAALVESCLVPKERSPGTGRARRSPRKPKPKPKTKPRTSGRPRS